ncbi:MAG: portal protein [Negativicutes bacterium]|nr:portal protein [Negativicutes bacterium]
MEFDRSKTERRWNDMRNEGQLWVPYWRDLKRWMNPMKGRFEGDLPQNVRKINHQLILNNCVLMALRIAAAGLHSGLTSPSRPWFRLMLGDPDLSEMGSIRTWLDLVEQRMFAVLAMSNMYKVFPAMYHEALQFGTACSIAEEDYDSVIFGRTLTCGQYYLAVDGKGRVDSMARRFDMTTLAIVNTFGLENCSPTIQKQYKDNNTGAWHYVYHMIEPNDDRIENRRDFKNKPFRSVYWDATDGCDKVMMLGGYDDFPVLAPRWETSTTSDAYGTSPGWECMGDQKTLQKMERDGLIGLAKKIDPPTVSSGTAKAINTMPGGVNAANPTAPNDWGLKAAYQVDLDFGDLDNYIARTEKRIETAHYVDLFKMLINVDQGPQMTAREVVEKHEEKMMNLGPVLENLNQELHAPFIRRLYGVMFRGGLIPPPPPEMQSQTLKVQFISILAQAQQMVASTSIQQSLGFIGSMAQLFPEAKYTVDAVETAIEYMTSNGMPAKCIRSKDEIQQLIQQEQQQQQQAQQAQTAMAMAQGAKTLSDAKLDPNNALGAITGAPQ